MMFYKKTFLYESIKVHTSAKYNISSCLNFSIEKRDHETVKFNSALKKSMFSSISTPETSENVFLFAFIPSFVSFGICICVHFFDAARKL